MSQVYINEPPTGGKVVLHTSVGDIDIELWTKEAPKACRNFIQLCLDGYYDMTIFHRIIKGFMAQGGDPTGTGRGGASIYGEDFPDEIHQRLRFSARGRVACASEDPGSNANGSQFFITLDATPWLDKQHTIFGKVVGDTIFNVVRLEGYEVDSEDRPTNPPYVKNAEVINHPFDDIVQRVTAPVEDEEEEETEEEKRRRRRRKKKNLKLLSFGDDAAEDEAAIESAPKLKIKAAHSVVKDSRLVDTTGDLSSARREAEKDREIKEADHKARKTKAKEAIRRAAGKGEGEKELNKYEVSAAKFTDVQDEKEFDERMREQVMAKMKKKGVDLEKKGQVAEDKPLPKPKKPDALVKQQTPSDVGLGKDGMDKEFKRLKRQLKRQREGGPGAAAAKTKPAAGKAEGEGDKNDDADAVVDYGEEDDDGGATNLKASSFNKSQGGSGDGDVYARVNAKKLKLKPKIKKGKLTKEERAARDKAMVEKLNLFSQTIRKERSKVKRAALARKDEGEKVGAEGYADEKAMTGTTADVAEDDPDDVDGWMTTKFELPHEKRRRMQEAALEEQKKALNDYSYEDPWAKKGGRSDSRSRHQRGLDKRRDDRGGAGGKRW